MITSILQESLSPTQVRNEFRPDAGRILYEKITNKDGDKFNAIIKFYMSGPEAFEITSCSVLGNHGIPKGHLDEIVEEIIQKAI